jgi:ketosteroid isomerase-like protein
MVFDHENKEKNKICCRKSYISLTQTDSCMKRLIAFLILCALGIPFSVFAQTGEEKQVMQQVENLRKAMVAADKNALDEVTATTLSYGHSNGLVQNKTAFIDDFVTGKSVFKSIALSDQTITISGDVAMVRHRLSGETNNDNTPGKADLLVLLIWQKQHGQWKLFARQAVKYSVQVN